jgi:hypothetical protein
MNQMLLLFGLLTASACTQAQAPGAVRPDKDAALAARAFLTNHFLTGGEVDRCIRSVASAHSEDRQSGIVAGQPVSGFAWAEARSVCETGVSTSCRTNEELRKLLSAPGNDPVARYLPELARDPTFHQRASACDAREANLRQ